MRTTLQTVPESLPVTDAHTPTTATTQSITSSESKSQSHSTSAPIKTRSSSSSKVSDRVKLLFFCVAVWCVQHTTHLLSFTFCCKIK